MAVTYTNRKGVTFFLCQSLTKTGKPRYSFARQPKGIPVEQIPDGSRVGESANGLVWRERDRPALLLPEEVAAVEAAIARHPRPRNYHVGVTHDQIVISERNRADTYVRSSDVRAPRQQVFPFCIPVPMARDPACTPSRGLATLYPSRIGCQAGIPKRPGGGACPTNSD